ncbi:MAG: hypothetical protein J0I88_03660 [Chryseobacterium sp.]|uniref:Uncharacterized protein n=1 Tax=Epilithonimonas pallida TaxID=373671 RepID=A0ABY1R5V1_9FLAO|nr:hypothetical protein [Epilithonimonas pallida]MBN9336930.1 hypothetical protein [Chryseobacterium sp.]OJX31929.1 MAG: hypothetical protein BGO86_06290 [Chryseobacterium sp. 36-9]SMP95447.1 hypothetical protein SAMN05421679_107116 [Epilithonimonas pallida]
MDLDNLKSLWNKEDVSETPEISTERQKEIHLPLEKIRKNMRNEFWSTIILLPIVLIAIWFFNIPFRFRLYIEVLVASMTLVTVFFFSKFFKLYREISNPTLGTYDSLKDLFHQFELNKQYYLSFYLSFVPFFVCEIIIITESIPYSHQYTDGLLAVKFIISILFGLFALYFFGNWWFKHFYGKYIDKIKKLVEDLK